MGLGLSKALVASIWSELAPLGWARPSLAERSTHFLGIYPTGDGVEEEAAVEGEDAEVARQAAAASKDSESSSQKFLAKREMSAADGDGGTVREALTDLERRAIFWYGDIGSGVSSPACLRFSFSTKDVANAPRSFKEARSVADEAEDGVDTDTEGVQEPPEAEVVAPAAEATPPELDVDVKTFKQAAKCSVFARETCNRIQAASASTRNVSWKYKYKLWTPVDPFWREIENLATKANTENTPGAGDVKYLDEVEECAQAAALNLKFLQSAGQKLLNRLMAGNGVAKIVRDHMESMQRMHFVRRWFSYGTKLTKMREIEEKLQDLCGGETESENVLHESDEAEVGNSSGPRWVTQADGGVYFGGWDNAANERKGKGMQLFPSDDAVYNGNWEQDERSGYGEQEWENGSVYTGEWKHDKEDGQGKMAWVAEQSKGEDDAADAWKKRGTYTGQWVAGNRHGQGSQDFGDGQRYSGHWEDDKPHGIGEMHWPDGTGNGEVAKADSQSSRMVMYKGPWIEGKPDTTKPSPTEGTPDASPGEKGSKGFAAYADGSEYDGGWKQGRRDGEGELTTPLDEKPKSSTPFQCLVQQGTWEDDQMQARDSGQKEEVALKQRAGGDQAGRGGRLESVGEHALREYTGGRNKEGQKHGSGIETEYDKSGTNVLRTYEGAWVNGKKHGLGTETKNPGTAHSVWEVGTWENDKKEGIFKRYYEDKAQTQGEPWSYKNGEVNDSGLSRAGGLAKRVGKNVLGHLGFL